MLIGDNHVSPQFLFNRDVVGSFVVYWGPFVVQHNCDLCQDHNCPVVYLTMQWVDWNGLIAGRRSWSSWRQGLTARPAWERLGWVRTSASSHRTTSAMTSRQSRLPQRNTKPLRRTSMLTRSECRPSLPLHRNLRKRTITTSSALTAGRRYSSL